MPISREICVPLQYDRRHTRDTIVPSTSRRRRLAGGIIQEGRFQRVHTCACPVLQVGGDCSRQDIPDFRLPQRASVAPFGSVAIPHLHNSPHTTISSRRQGYQSGGSLGRPGRARHFHVRKKTIVTLLETKKQIAASRLLGLTKDQTHHVMERAVEYGLSRRRHTIMYSHIHIDEKSRRGHDYVSIIYADDGTVLEVVGGRKREDAKRLINKALNPIQQANVLTLTIDMWDNFRDAALELMPQVRICHDPYHLVGHLQDAVDSVRRCEVKGNDILKRSRFLFLKDQENLTAKEQIRFDSIVKTNLEVANAWRIKEEFRDIVKAKSEHARMFILYLMWRQRAKAANIPEITKVIDMFDRHERGILNALKLDKSNGRAERMNGSIQELKTIGRGYRDVERFRIAILFFHGGLKLHRDL